MDAEERPAASQQNSPREGELPPPPPQAAPPAVHTPPPLPPPTGNTPPIVMALPAPGQPSFNPNSRRQNRRRSDAAEGVVGEEEMTERKAGEEEEQQQQPYDYPPLAQPIGRSSNNHHLYTQPSYEVVTGVPVDFEDSPAQPQQQQRTGGGATAAGMLVVIDGVGVFVVDQDGAGGLRQIGGPGGADLMDDHQDGDAADRRRRRRRRRNGADGDDIATTDDDDDDNNIRALVIPLPGATPSNVNEQKVVNIFRLSRSVRWASMIEFALTILFALNWLWFLILIPLPVFGYVGARMYRLLALLVFLIFFPVAIGFRAFRGYDFYQKQDGPLRLVLCFVTLMCIVVDLGFLILTVRFMYRLKSASEEEMEMLRTEGGGGTVAGGGDDGATAATTTDTTGTQQRRRGQGADTDDE